MCSKGIPAPPGTITVIYCSPPRNGCLSLHAGTSGCGWGESVAFSRILMENERHQRFPSAIFFSFQCFRIPFFFFFSVFRVDCYSCLAFSCLKVSWIGLQDIQCTPWCFSFNELYHVCWSDDMIMILWMQTSSFYRFLFELFNRNYFCDQWRLGFAVLGYFEVFKESFPYVLCKFSVVATSAVPENS